LPTQGFFRFLAVFGPILDQNALLLKKTQQTCKLCTIGDKDRHFLAFLKKFSNSEKPTYFGQKWPKMAFSH
jgi:hypothetical protein